jgi:general secretion pathway protein M
MAIKLNKREKIGVAAAAAAILIFLVIAVSGFSPVREKRPAVPNAGHPAAGTGADPALQQEYRQTAEKAEQAKRHLKRRKRGFTLFSFLETLAGKTGVKSRISYMRPSTTTSQKESPYRLSKVEMKLQDITMPQLLAYLHGIETSRGHDCH